MSSEISTIRNNESLTESLHNLAIEHQVPYLTIARSALENSNLVEENNSLRDQNDQNEYLITHDHLTGLDNRLGIMRKIDERVKGYDKGKDFGIMLLDLDKFKAVNDTMGHDGGDELLVTLSDYLKGAFGRKTDVIAVNRSRPNSKNQQADVGRLGGDEFIIIVDLSEGDDQKIKRPNTVEERLSKAESYASETLHHFFTELVPDKVRNIGAYYSIGSAAFELVDGDISVRDQIKLMFKRADDLLYEQKKARGHSRE